MLAAPANRQIDGFPVSSDSAGRPSGRIGPQYGSRYSAIDTITIKAMSAQDLSDLRFAVHGFGRFGALNPRCSPATTPDPEVHRSRTPDEDHSAAVDPPSSTASAPG